MIDIDGLWEHIGQVATFASFVLAIKFVACLTAASFLKIPGRMGIMASTALTNVGEFSLVLIPFMQEISPIPALVTTNVYAIAAVSSGHDSAADEGGTETYPAAGAQFPG